MGTQGVNGAGVAVTAVGALLVWSGIKGVSVTQSLRSLISGQQPSGTATSTLTAASASAAAPGGSVPSTGISGGYSHSQLESIWRLGGGSAATANVAAAVAMAESSGHPDATSANPDGGTNVGLWQLDTPGGVGAGYSVAQLKDAATNARVAVQGSADGTNWSQWETYVTGAYRQYLGSS